MPRRARFAGRSTAALVVAHSSRSRTLFTSPAEFAAHVGRLERQAAAGHLVLYGYCLLPNRLALLVRPALSSLARIVQRLHSPLSRAVNARDDATGAVFDGRFQSAPIPDGSLVEVVRALHLWPVHRGRVWRAQAYAHSSDWAYRNPGASFVERGLIIAGLPAVPAHAAPSTSVRPLSTAYARYVDHPTSEPRGVEALLSAFGAAVPTPLPGRAGSTHDVTLARIADVVTNAFGLERNALLGRARHAPLPLARRTIATLAVMRAGLTATAVAAAMGRSQGQVSRWVSYGSAHALRDAAYAAHLSGLWRHILGPRG